MVSVIRTGIWKREKEPEVQLYYKLQKQHVDKFREPERDI